MSDTLEEDAIGGNEPNETDNVEADETQRAEEVEDPGIRIPENGNLEIGNPEGENPENGNPEGENPENGNPEGENPENGNPEGENPEIGNPEGENPENGNNQESENPDGENLDGENLVTGRPENENTETETPEHEKPDRGSEGGDVNDSKEHDGGAGGDEGDGVKVEEKKEEDKSQAGESMLTLVASLNEGRVTSGMAIAELIIEEILDRVFEEIGKEPDRASVVTIKSAGDQSQQTSEHVSEGEAERLEAERQKEELFKTNVALYHQLVAARIGLKRKNAYLVKRMYEHYKRKQIEHLFKEIPSASADMEDRYIRALTEYQEVRDSTQQEEEKNAAQLAALTEKRDEVVNVLREEFENFLERERELGKSLICVVTGKPIPEKEIEKLTQRQIVKSEAVARVRLIFFKLKDMVTSEEAKLKSMEQVGENLTLMEYDKLKMYSQSSVEKLEEKEAELSRLRAKATSAIQALAELREKAHATLVEIESEKVTLHDVEMHLYETRERVGGKKTKRDITRSDVVRLRQEAGLLAEPKLQRDYKLSAEERDQLSSQLTDLKNVFDNRKKRIDSLREVVSRAIALARV